MSPEEIRLELFKRRKTVTQVSIAKSLGVTPQSVLFVIDRKIVSKRIMQAIADAIGHDKTYVFPERFLRKTTKTANGCVNRQV